MHPARAACTPCALLAVDEPMSCAYTCRIEGKHAWMWRPSDGLDSSPMTEDVANLLEDMGFRVLLQVPINHVHVDLGLPNHGVAVEVEGHTHITRNTGEMLGAPILKHRLLNALGQKVVRMHYAIWKGRTWEYRNAVLEQMLRQNGVKFPSWDENQASPHSHKRCIGALASDWRECATAAYLRRQSHTYVKGLGAAMHDSEDEGSDSGCDDTETSTAWSAPAPAMHTSEADAAAVDCGGDDALSAWSASAPLARGSDNNAAAGSDASGSDTEADRHSDARRSDVATASGDDSSGSAAVIDAARRASDSPSNGDGSGNITVAASDGSSSESAGATHEDGDSHSAAGMPDADAGGSAAATLSDDGASNRSEADSTAHAHEHGIDAADPSDKHDGCRESEGIALESGIIACQPAGGVDAADTAVSVASGSASAIESSPGASGSDAAAVAHETVSASESAASSGKDAKPNVSAAALNAAADGSDTATAAADGQNIDTPAAPANDSGKETAPAADIGGGTDVWAASDDSAGGSDTAAAADGASGRDVWAPASDDDSSDDDTPDASEEDIERRAQTIAMLQYRRGVLNKHQLLMKAAQRAAARKAPLLGKRRE